MASVRNVFVFASVVFFAEAANELARGEDLVEILSVIIEHF